MVFRCIQYSIDMRTHKLPRGLLFEDISEVNGKTVVFKGQVNTGPRLSHGGPLYRNRFLSA